MISHDQKTVYREGRHEGGEGGKGKVKTPRLYARLNAVAASAATRAAATRSYYKPSFPTIIMLFSSVSIACTVFFPIEREIKGASTSHGERANTGIRKIHH